MPDPRRPLLLLALSACAPAQVRPGGNQLIVVIDDVGIDQVGAYGVGLDPPKTPVIDGLAATGLRFHNAWGAPTCSPARAALLTGRGPGKTGIGTVVNVDDPPRSRLRLREQTLAELLRREAGYQTAAVGKWHLVSPNRWGHRGHPERQGFDRWTGTLGPPSASAELDGQGTYHHWVEISDRKASVVRGYEPVRAIEAAIEAMDELEPPWVVYVALNLAHTPLHTPPPELVHTPVGDDPSERDQYRAMVEAADTLVGRLVAAIPDNAVANTTIWVTSDNGTPHHGIRPPQNPHRGKDTLYEGGVRVPLIVHSPLVAQPGSRSDALVSLVDLLPTMAEIAGISSRRTLDGISLLPQLADPTAPAHTTLFTETFATNNARPGRRGSGRQGIRDATHKWTVDHGETALYRLDPEDLTEKRVEPDAQTDDDRAHAKALREALERVSR